MSQQERETEEDEGGCGSDMTPMLPQRFSDHQTSPGWAGLATRGLGTLLLPSRTAIVFLLVLLPAAAVVYLGFLCHSRVHSAPRPPCRAPLILRLRFPTLSAFSHCRSCLSLSGLTPPSAACHPHPGPMDPTATRSPATGNWWAMAWTRKGSFVTEWDPEDSQALKISEFLELLLIP
ncbi:PREDICTED: transmembrane protein 88B-like [Chrysochloris asiatica]|uniref:Transmembrane protein 88B-like n=1 Tax=Chrysochloris asiatica TaxID=185453 RepID=A0A9B0SUZ8_CHRAS|nr:PREDICTED: transmembrane protein 88B-like [Chrysochloris asiatica]